MGLIDAIDTYYDYIYQRITAGLTGVDGTFRPAINAQRKFGGVVEAHAWPPTEVSPESFYLQILTQDPQPMGTRANNYYRYMLQWTWVVEGTDLQAGQQGQNRGNRYRQNQQMREELRQASFPLFCPLNQISLDASNNIVRTPYEPMQTCRWVQPSFIPRQALGDDSGVLYGAAAVDVFAFQQPLT